MASGEPGDQRGDHRRPLPHVILQDRVAAGDAMLVAKPLEHPLCGVPLLAVNRAITLNRAPVAR